MADRYGKAGSDTSTIAPLLWPLLAGNNAYEYWIDAWQRSILLLDTLRERGNNYVEHNARTAPHVLSFPAELVLNGRTLPRPVVRWFVIVFGLGLSAYEFIKRLG